MTTASKNALLLLQAAGAFQHKLAGELAAVHGLSVNDFLLMLHLEQVPEQGLPRTELARRMRVSASTVTRMARPMEKIGLMDRVANPRDARLALVVLTDTGRTRLTEAKATFVKRAEALFGVGWTAAELAELTGLLGRLSTGDLLDAVLD